MPAEVLGGVMFWVAAAGLAVNIAAYFILQGGDRTNLNVRAAALHVAGDLLGSVAAIIAAVVIMTTGWTPIDPILSVFVAVIILRSAWNVVRESGHILLEGAPPHLDARAIGADLMQAVPAVRDVHHMHIWSITDERPMITLHAVILDGQSAPAAVAAIKARLRDRYGVEHATVEIEHNACSDADDACAAPKAD